MACLSQTSNVFKITDSTDLYFNFLRGGLFDGHRRRSGGGNVFVAK